MGRRSYGTSVMSLKDMGLNTMSMPIQDDPEEDRDITPSPPPQDKPDTQDPPADDGRPVQGDSSVESSEGSGDYTLIGLAALAAIVATIMG
jgi:hypothetical protein